MFEYGITLLRAAYNYAHGCELVKLSTYVKMQSLIKMKIACTFLFFSNFCTRRIYYQRYLHTTKIYKIYNHQILCRNGENVFDPSFSRPPPYKKSHFRDPPSIQINQIIRTLLFIFSLVMLKASIIPLTCV